MGHLNRISSGLLLATVAWNWASAKPLKSWPNNSAAYAGSESCRKCHRAEYDLWRHSHHALAERWIQPKLDKAAFSPTRRFKAGSLTNTIRIHNGQYQIVTLGFNTNIAPYRVVRVIGDDPVEQFLTPYIGGRFQVQEVSYNPESNQWFDVYGNQNRQPGEWGHWTGRGMNWNSRCAECHNTDLKKNYNPVTDSYHTTMAEMGVSCEACHGPLKAHVEWQEAHPHSKLPDPTIKPFSKTQWLDTCGTCHSRNVDLTGDFKPGHSFFNHYDLEILDDSERWYPDGQVHDEDYEFVSFLSSKMYQAGVTCMDCHNPHSGKTILTGNNLCMRCHNGSYPKAPKINIVEHTHHLPTSPGNLCVNCHMPVTVYMQCQPRRDHGFTIPEPLLTKEFDVPNACNRCHTKRSADWSLKYTTQWYGTNMNRPTLRRAEWIARAERGNKSAEAPLIGLLSNTNQSFYWRAVAATFLEQWAADPPVKKALLSKLTARNPLVREQVVRSLAPMVNDKSVQTALKKMLNDPSRNVRAAAAWVMRATVNMQSRGGRDLQQMLDLEADQPTGQFEEANLLLARQQPVAALAHLQKATAWDPMSPPFLCAQAEVQDQLGHLNAALKTLDQAETAVPDDPHIPYVRAVIWAHNGHYDRARAAAQRTLKIQSDFTPARELLQQLPATN